MFSADRSNKSADETVPDENPRVNHLRQSYSIKESLSGHQIQSNRSNSHNSHISDNRRSVSRGSQPNNTITMHDISRQSAGQTVNFMYITNKKKVEPKPIDDEEMMRLSNQLLDKSGSQQSKNIRAPSEKPPTEQEFMRLS